MRDEPLALRKEAPFVENAGANAALDALDGRPILDVRPSEKFPRQIEAG